MLRELDIAFWCNDQKQISLRTLQTQNILQLLRSDNHSFHGVYYKHESLYLISLSTKYLYHFVRN